MTRRLFGSWTATATITTARCTATTAAPAHPRPVRLATTTAAVLAALWTLPAAGAAQATTPPVVPSDSPKSARLEVRVAFTEVEAGGPGQAVVDASLVLGAEAAASGIRVADPTLHVLGEALQPTGTGQGGRLLYHLERELDPRAFRRPLELVPPRLTGVRGPPPRTVAWEGIGNLTPGVVRVPAGRPLGIRLDRGEELRPEAQLAGWSLTLTPPGQRPTVARGQGTPPAELVVPPNLIPRGDAPVPVELRFDAEVRDPLLPDGGYGVTVDLSVRLTWTLETVEGS